MSKPVVLDGSTLTISQLERVARNPSVQVELHPDAMARIRKSAAIIRKIVSTPGQRVYGVTTGFGEFKDRPIPPRDQIKLQHNLLLSHSVGVGENTNPDDLSNYYPPEVVRGALTTRLNAFARGHSGVRPELVQVVAAMLNRGVIPLVPLRGSVGASGDLCPLSHLFVTLLGEGRYYVWTGGSARPVFHAASTLPKVLGFTAKEMLPRHKEALALINGANFSSAMLALAVYDAAILADTADVAAAMTLEALCGCSKAFDEKVHEARPHDGQQVVAFRIRELTRGSTRIDKTKHVQDAYSLRCAPQVHGASRDAIAFATGVAQREINSATDNPLFFPPDDAAYSAGNFHGQPVALASDFLTIALAELANISERRTQMLLDGNHNRNLPANLTTRAGVHSGLMIAQYTAASLVSENKVLSHPASVDSIPTSANSEDHVSMATHAARKMRTVLGNVQSVIAIELMAAAQALEWRIVFEIPGDKLSEKKLLAFRPDRVELADEQQKRFIREVSRRSATIADRIPPGLQQSYRQIRKLVSALDRDRPLDRDIRLLRESLALGKLTGAIRP
jgi:histidine ammonia-lyase